MHMGYPLTLVGSVLGRLGGLVDGAIGGAVFAALYPGPAGEIGG